VIEQTHAWRCGACNARGTLVTIGETEVHEGTFHCPQCGAALTECRRTRRATPAGRRTAGEATASDDEALAPQDVERCAFEWSHTHEILGSLGVMAESNWALDWADRLLAEVRRRQAG
jgi:predicted RNA-binding Zn-ribbon protein involved in translation (DUF1610 family)